MTTNAKIIEPAPRICLPKSKSSAYYIAEAYVNHEVRSGRLARLLHNDGAGGFRRWRGHYFGLEKEAALRQELMSFCLRCDRETAQGQKLHRLDPLARRHHRQRLQHRLQGHRTPPRFRCQAFGSCSVAIVCASNRHSGRGVAEFRIGDVRAPFNSVCHAKKS